MPLVLRTLAKNDFSVIEEGHPVGRIRLASERRPQIWMWNIPELGGGTGTPPDLDEA